MRLFALTFLLLASGFAFAAKKNETITDSLVLENQSLSVGLEDTVQVRKPESRRTFSLFVGRESAKKLNLHLDGQDTNYNLDGWTALNLQYGHYPFRRRVMLGILGGLGYSYVENHIGERDTALHIFPVEAMLSSRYAFNPRFEAQLSAGGGSMITVQRGDETDNSSQAKGYGVWQAAFSYGPRVDVDMPWEILAMYGQRFGPSSESQNWNGSFVRLGIGLRLE